MVGIRYMKTRNKKRLAYNFVRNEVLRENNRRYKGMDMLHQGTLFRIMGTRQCDGKLVCEAGNRRVYLNERRVKEGIAALDTQRKEHAAKVKASLKETAKHKGDTSPAHNKKRKRRRGGKNA